MIVSTIFRLTLLMAVSQANSVPSCISPPPPPSLLPGLDNCLSITRAVIGIARIQRNIPQVWSRAPTAPGHGVSLPASFSFPGPGFQWNNCEFIVDTISENAVDIFPIIRIARAADALITECLIGTSREASTVGEILAGPRQVVQVTLRKKVIPQRFPRTNSTVLTSNGTKLVVELAGS